MKKHQALRDNAIAAANAEGVEVSLDDFYIDNPSSKYCLCLPKENEVYEEFPELIEPIMRNWEYVIIYYLAAKRNINKLNELENTTSIN